MFFTNSLNVEVAGDSHGPQIVSFIEGIPFGMPVNKSYIDRMLELRQSGFGRGARMKLEKDEVEILSGTWKGKTTGMPVVLAVKNRGSYPESETQRNIPRPGHCDYAAFMKYKDPDMRIYAEGASARRTAGVVACGAFLKYLLETRGIFIEAFVESVKDVKTDVLSMAFNGKTDMDFLKREKMKNDLFIPDQKTYSKAREAVIEAMNRGDTLGGTVKVFASGIEGGTGSYSTPSKRLDSLICANLMSIPSAKGVFIGAENIGSLYGSEAHDEFSIADNSIRRTGNNAGGIEGGISNSQDIIATVHFKPIPSVKKSLNSVDVLKKMETHTEYVRSDVTAIAPAVQVCESVMAITIFDAVLSNGLMR